MDELTTQIRKSLKQKFLEGEQKAEAKADSKSRSRLTHIIENSMPLVKAAAASIALYFANQFLLPHAQEITEQYPVVCNLYSSYSHYAAGLLTYLASICSLRNRSIDTEIRAEKYNHIMQFIEEVAQSSSKGIRDSGTAAIEETTSSRHRFTKLWNAAVIIAEINKNPEAALDSQFEKEINNILCNYLTSAGFGMCYIKPDKKIHSPSKAMQELTGVKTSGIKGYEVLPEDIGKITAKTINEIPLNIFTAELKSKGVYLLIASKT